MIMYSIERRRNDCGDDAPWRGYPIFKGNTEQEVLDYIATLGADSFWDFRVIPVAESLHTRFQS